MLSQEYMLMCMYTCAHPHTYTHWHTHTRAHTHTAGGDGIPTKPCR